MVALGVLAPSRWVSVLMLVVVAGALRLWHLADIPRYADEINEIMPAFAIARGQSFPLVSGPKHIGAAFDYLLAAAFLVFGRSPDLPRLVVAAGGIATVLLVYGYARSLSSHRAGLLAAGLLAVSAPHVLLSSRVAWSVSLVPLLIVGVAWSLDLAVTRGRTQWLLVSGLLAGLALQAHPAVASLFPGLGLFVVLRGAGLLRRPEPYLAIGLLLLGCANVLVYNWLSGIGGLRSVTQEYPGQTIGLADFVANAAAPLHGLILTLASAIDPTHDPVFLSPFVVLVAGVCTLSLIYAARRVTLLPILVTAGALLTLPLLHDDFGPLLKARYVMPLLPLIFVAVGVFGADMIGAATTPPIRRVGAIVVWVTMASGMLAALLRFEATVLAADCTNVPQRAFVAELERHQTPHEWVLLDEGIVRSAERVGYLTLLELSRARIGEARLGRGGVWTELEERESFLTAVDDSKVAMIFAKQGIPLLSVSPDTAESGIGLYRVTAGGATLLFHDASPGCGALRTN